MHCTILPQPINLFNFSCIVINLIQSLTHILLAPITVPYATPMERLPSPPNYPCHVPSADEIAKPIIDRELSRAYPQTWAAMEILVEKDKAKMIGRAS